jgi:hypothetical protein
MRRVDLRELSAAHRRLFDEAASAQIGEFNELISSLYPVAPTPEALLDGSLSRSPFVGGLYLDCCRLAFIDRLLSGEGFDEVVVGDPILAEVIDGRLRRDGVRAQVILEKDLFDGFLAALRPGARLLKTSLRFARRWAAGLTLPRPTPSSPITLLDTFLLDGSCNGGRFVDRYYIGSQEFLTDTERSGFYYVPELPERGSVAGLLGAAQATGERFLFKEAFLRVEDYFAALVWPLNDSLDRTTPRTFCGFDVAPLIQRDRSVTAWNSMSLAAFLNFRFMKRLKEAGIPLRLVVDWSENQLLDRGLVLGTRSSFPKTPVVGYAGFIKPALAHPYAQPTSREQDLGLVNDRLYVSGPGLVDAAKAYCPGLETTAGPAFRFAHVWKDHGLKTPSQRPTILGALPISISGSLEILGLLRDAALPGELKGARVLLKAHPALDVSAVKAGFGAAWPESYEFFTGDFAGALEQADIMLSSASSACLEALSRGVPVIVAGAQRELTENPIPPWVDPSIWRLAYNSEELTRGFAELFSRDAARLKRYAEIGQSVREQCFEPVTPQGARRLFQLDRTKT